MSDTQPPPPGSTPATGVNALQVGFTRLAIENNDSFAPRMATGTAGKETDVLANMFKVEITGNKPVFHYDVTVTPVVKTTSDKLNKNLAWKIWKQLQAEAKTLDPTGGLAKTLEQGAYDQGKSMFTSEAIPGGGQTTRTYKITLQEPGGRGGDDDNRKRYNVSLKPAQKLDLDNITKYCRGEKQSQLDKDRARSAIQAINVLLRQSPYERNYFPTLNGHKFLAFEARDDAVPIANGAFVHKGFMQSFRPTISGHPAIQLDTAYSACIKPGNLIMVLGEMLGGDLMKMNPGPMQWRDLSRKLRTAKFKVTHSAMQQDRIYTIMGLTERPAEQEEFVIEGKDGAANQKTNLVAYYKKQYNKQVTKPRLPCVKYGKNNKVPLEFVMLQPFHRIQPLNLDTIQSGQMIKITAKKPDDRRAASMEWRQRLDYDKLPKIKAWGLDVSKDMMKVKARVLPPPTVQYGAGRIVPAKGTWNVGRNKFFKPGQLVKSWGVLLLDQRCDVKRFGAFMDRFSVELKNAGISASVKPHIVLAKGHGFNAISQSIKHAADATQAQFGTPPQLLFVIVGDSAVYKEIKRAALEVWKQPIVTQIMQSSKCFDDRGIQAYMGNLSMKIQAKVGGITHTASHPRLDASTMMIGADVTHPPAQKGAFGGQIQPSIAVTVATISGANNQVKEAIRLQKGGQEIIEGMTDMVIGHLQTFHKNTKTYPKKILMFRDGVSEGQYGQVVQCEMARIKAAAREVGGNSYKPTITFVVCGKRHRMRFYATKDLDRDRIGNLPAGSVVDSGVTDPFLFEFYLQSHAGLQGTARPTHYVVVADENGFKADDMQGLCNTLCYTYARAAKAVSLIPVTYYADVIAGKCRDFLYSSDDTSSVSATGASDTFNPLEFKAKIENSAMGTVGWSM